MFCSEKSSTLLCTSDRRALGHCPIVEYVGPLPRNYQYFKKDNIGGKRATLMDICPIIEPYVDSSCITGRASSMPGSIVGPSSACLKSVALRWDSEPVGDVCAEVLCGERTVHVRYLGNDTWHLCPEGAHITPGRPFTHGRILCPRRLDVCAASHISERDLHEREMVRLRGTS
ncbi:putative surface protease GP63, putative,metallopeptidase [Trypanosoma grayi]|uniref:putative surface protease GP63, putative,metallopeptidase n=1 Tax=Trypanosoma grayi TaxID=71804 RepID=UPI0004F3FEA7|nr:putative surface protease GP63, putative,metallopeptidase [Trypanosoma grayi]KEG05656.1 putative surface protease GP63, putative,metallopeptidase [Trypanosoma grayi]